MPKPPSKRSRKEVRRLKAEIRGYLADGALDRDIASELEIGMSDLRNLKRQLLTDELEEITTDTPHEVWAKYRIRMSGCIGDLDEIISIAKGDGEGEPPKGGLAAAVNATKAKAQILDGILKKGQELGVIHREPEKKVVIGGISVSSASIKELRELVDSRRKKVEEMVTEYAPTALVDYADEPDEDLYTEPAAEKIPVRRKVVVE